MNLRKKLEMISAILLVGLAGLVIFNQFLNKEKEIELSTEASLVDSFNAGDTYSIQFDYPAEALVSELSEADKNANILIRFGINDTPKYLVTVRGEKSLRIASQLARLDVIDLVVDGALKSNPSRYEDYNLLRDSRLENPDIDSHELIFSYKNPSGGVTKQRLVLVSNDPNAAIYIAMQAAESDFDSINTEVFQKIVDSIRPTK